MFTILTECGSGFNAYLFSEFIMLWLWPVALGEYEVEDAGDQHSLKCDVVGWGLPWYYGQGRRNMATLCPSAIHLLTDISYLEQIGRNSIKYSHRIVRHSLDRCVNFGWEFWSPDEWTRPSLRARAATAPAVRPYVSVSTERKPLPLASSADF